MGDVPATQAQGAVGNGWKLLETRKKQLESAKLQTAAVQAKFNNLEADIAKTKPLDAELAQKIMILSNFSDQAKKGGPGEKPAAPKLEATDPGAEPSVPKEGEASEEQIKAASIEHDSWVQKKQEYDAKVKEHEAKLKEYNEKTLPKWEADKKEYDQYVALADEIDKKAPEDVKKHLNELMDAAQKTEAELKAAQGTEAELQREVDFSWAEYQKLNEDLKNADFSVTLREQGDGEGKVKGNDNLTRAAKDLINAASVNNIDLSKYKKEDGSFDMDKLKQALEAVGNDADTQTVYNNILAADKANGAESSKYHYSHMKAGDSHQYTFNQVKAMGGDALDLDLSDDFGTELRDLLKNAPDAPIDKPTAETPTKPTAPAVKPSEEDSSGAVDPKYKKGKDGEIVLPQGDIKVGDATKPDAESTYATELAHYGIVEKDGKYYRAKKDENGNLVPRDNRAFTADEINKYFRQVEKDFGIKPGSSTETKTKTDVPAATTTNPSAEALRGFAAGYFDVDGSGVLTSPTVEGDKLVATGSDGKKYQAVFSNGAVSGWTPVTSTPAALAEVGAGDRPAVTTNTPSSSISVSSLPQQLQSAINGFEESEGKTVFKFDGQRADTYVTWSKTKNADGKFEMTFDVDGQKYRLAADKRSLIKVE